MGAPRPVADDTVDSARQAPIGTRTATCIPHSSGRTTRVYVPPGLLSWFTSAGIVIVTHPQLEHCSRGGRMDGRWCCENQDAEPVRPQGHGRLHAFLSCTRWTGGCRGLPGRILTPPVAKGAESTGAAGQRLFMQRRTSPRRFAGRFCGRTLLLHRSWTGLSLSGAASRLTNSFPSCKRPPYYCTLLQAAPGPYCIGHAATFSIRGCGCGCIHSRTDVYAGPSFGWFIVPMGTVNLGLGGHGVFGVPLRLRKVGQWSWLEEGQGRACPPRRRSLRPGRRHVSGKHVPGLRQRCAFRHRCGEAVGIWRLCQWR